MVFVYTETSPKQMVKNDQQSTQ